LLISMRVPPILSLLVPFLVFGCAARLGHKSESLIGERLAVERGRLSELQDPIERTRSYITISDLLLDFVADAARDHDAESLMPLVNQYVSTIRSARDTIVNSDRQAIQKAVAYKDLEIAISLQTRRLQAITGALTIDERPPFERALSAANSIGEEMMGLLFP
jgi:hypothetical protein